MIKPHNKGTLLTIRAKPRSKSPGIKLEGDAVCSVYVKAPPIRGQANSEIVKLIAKRLNIPTHNIRIMSGEKTSTKTLLIEGMDPQTVFAALKM
ncbi:MAG: DUF167 domain-containing protein [Candidatus Hermodarchaeia archaeon]|jgi:uncharacterized protein (TIGR00251 family)